MAFATKYRLKSVSDVFGGIEVDLQKDGYSGSVTELTGISPNGATLKIGKNSQNIFEPILSGELELLWYIEDATDTLELATDAPRTWLAIVKQQGSGDEIWRGWISPKSYQEQYTAQPYAVSVIANDKLEELKASKFTIGTGKDTLWDFLRQALAETDIDLPFKESINIYDTAMISAAGDSPLVQAEAENVSFEGITREPSNYQALAEILRPFGARIFQWAGHWHIENIYQKSASYVERIYNAAGVYQSQSTVNPLVTLDKTMPDFRALIGQSGAINTVSNVNTARIFFKNIPGEPSSPIPGFSTDADWTDSSTLANWTKSGSFTITQITSNYNNNKFAAGLLGAQNSLNDNNRITSQGYTVTAATFQNLTLGFAYNMNWPALVLFGSKPILYVEIKLVTGSGTFYYKDGWSTAVQRNPIQASKRQTFETWSATISDVPDDGTLTVVIYQLVKTGSTSNTNVFLTDWNFTVTQASDETSRFAVDTGTLNVTGDLIPYDLEVYLADGVNANQPGALTVGGVKTEEWSRRGKTDDITLQRLYLLQFLSMHQRPTLRLQGTMYQQGEQIAPWQTVQDNASISTRKYVMTSYTLGLSNGQGQVIYRELIDTDATVTYLREYYDSLEQAEYQPPLQPNLPSVPGDGGGLLPDFPQIDGLNGDTFGPIGSNTLSKSAIVEKPVLDVTTPPTSSEIVINAVKDESDSLPMTKISAKDFIINAYASKATPVAADRLVISDSEDSDELKVISISDLPIDGSKWTQLTGDNIGRTVGNVAFGNFNPSERIHVGGTDKIRIGNFTIQGSDGSFATRMQGALNRRILFNGEDGSGSLILFSDSNGAQLSFSTAHTLARRSLALFEMVTYNTFRVTGTESGSLTIIEFSNGGSAQESQVKIPNIPTSDPLIAGVLWSDGGTIKISAG